MIGWPAVFKMYPILVLMALISNASDDYICCFSPPVSIWHPWFGRHVDQGCVGDWRGSAAAVCGCGTVWILRALLPQNCRASCQSLSNPPTQSPLTSSTPVWPNPHILLSSPHRSKVPVRPLSSSPSSIASSLGSLCQSPPALSLFLAERHGPAMAPHPNSPQTVLRRVCSGI